MLVTGYAIPAWIGWTGHAAVAFQSAQAILLARVFRFFTEFRVSTGIVRLYLQRKKAS
jgi:hypothetical protein